MTTATLAMPSHATRDVPSTPSSDRRMLHSRLIGGLFLAGFLAYGTGFGLVTSVISAPDFLASMATHRTTLVLGAILMLLTIVTDVWRAVLFYPVLGRRGRETALTYLAAQVISVSMFFVGSLALLLLVPLGAYASGTDPAWATGLGALLVAFNDNTYQLSQLALAFGSLSLWIYGVRVGLIPRAFAAYAILGYGIHLSGTIAELFGFAVGDYLLIPGALFEIALPFWLFVRGFEARAYARAS